ncbi:Putative LOC100877443, partial [Caligus rogercresseyi]
MKRMRLDASEKNKKAPQLSCGLNNASELKEALEADTVWEKYLSENESIIAKSFHGQFKKQSRLLRAINKEITLTFIRNGSLPLRLRLTLTQVDKVGDLKTKLREVLSLGQERKIQVVEVFDHHISRFLEDWTSLKFLKEDREIYALEVVEKVFEEEEEVEDEDPMGSSEECILASQDYQTCIICMEDLPPSDLRQHNACDCVLCLSCMDRTIEHHQKEEDSSLSGQIKCPGCRLDADPVSEFLPLDKTDIKHPLVYRLDHSEEEDNNKKNVETLGHPFLLSLSNIVSGKKLYELLDPLVRVLTPEDYSLVLVNAQ